MRSRLAKPRWLLLALAAGCSHSPPPGAAEATIRAAQTSRSSDRRAHRAPRAPAATDTGATPTTETAAPEQANLKLALDWFPNPDHVALYYAQDKGYWTIRISTSR